jgi:hypothetical protein
MDANSVKMSQSVGKCTPIVKDHPAGYSNDPSVPAPHVGGLLSHDCKRERGGTKTAGIGPYVMVVKNQPGDEPLPQL